MLRAQFGRAKITQIKREGEEAVVQDLFGRIGRKCVSVFV